MHTVLLDYGPQIESFTDSLLRRLRQNLGNPVAINELTVHYSYDVMNHLAFGQSGGFIDGTSSETSNEVLDGIRSGFDAIGLFSHVPWIMTLLTTFAAFLPGPMRAINNWSNQALIRRKKVHSFHILFFGYS
jgi:hypothetical protein